MSECTRFAVGELPHELFEYGEADRLVVDDHNLHFGSPVPRTVEKRL
jgi:hypothetical protein